MRPPPYSHSLPQAIIAVAALIGVFAAPSGVGAGGMTLGHILCEHPTLWTIRLSHAR
ncbi:MAG: hypothetical protein J2P51_18190 [Hyphomicrobiaceae bacterium]|nr:hypothetical protein [Hyphomicrobiaceae bacterium]